MKKNRYSFTVFLSRLKWGALMASLPTVVATLVAQDALDPKTAAWITAGVAILTTAFGADVKSFLDNQKSDDTE